MNFALLGETDACAAVLRACLESGAHSISHVACLTNESSLIGTFPSLRRVDRWEDLLGDESIEAILVAGADPETANAARQLGSSGRPLAVIPSSTLGSAFAYELTLVRDESLVTLYPILPHRLSATARRLHEVCTSGELGDLVQVRCERSVEGIDGLLGPTDVEHRLATDADLLRWVAGNCDQVTALYQGHRDAGFTNAVVSLAGTNSVDASWTLLPGNDRLEVQVVGTKGRAVFCVEAGRETLRVGAAEPLPVVTEGAAEDWVKQLPEALTEAFSGGSHEDSAATWTDMVRAFEVVDAHRRSIRRRRTIDLHFETTSERSQFKTQMSAVGCGVLLFTLVGLIAYLVMAEVFEPPKSVLYVVRVLWILPLALFLLAQLLLGLTRPSVSETATSTESTV